MAHNLEQGLLHGVEHGTSGEVGRGVAGELGRGGTSAFSSVAGSEGRGLGGATREFTGAAADAVERSAAATADTVKSLLRDSQATTEALETISNQLKELKSSSKEIQNGMNEIESLGKANPDVQNAIKELLGKGGSPGFLASNKKTIAALSIILAGYALQSKLISADQCKKNCKMLLSPEPTLGLFGGGTECKQGCGVSGLGPKVGPAGGWSDQNCCCNPPGPEKLLETTSQKCSSFCAEDCKESNRLKDARLGVMQDPAGALSAAADRGFDTLATGATAGLDAASWVSLNLPYIIVGIVVLIGVPFLYYMIKGIISGVKDSGKVVAEAAKGKGANIVKEQVKKIPGVKSRRGRR